MTSPFLLCLAELCTCMMSHISQYLMPSLNCSVSIRLQHLRGGSRLHSVPVWRPEQEKGHQGDLHPLHLCHRHQERAVCVRCRHWRHHQEQPEGLRPFLKVTSAASRMSWCRRFPFSSSNHVLFLCVQAARSAGFPSDFIEGDSDWREREWECHF